LATTEFFFLILNMSFWGKRAKSKEIMLKYQNEKVFSLFIAEFVLVFNISFYNVVRLQIFYRFSEGIKTIRN
jgi:hypothetical protein